MPSLQDTLNPPRRAAARAEHARRQASGLIGAERYQRSGSEVFAWAHAHMPPDLWQRLAAVRVGRQQAAQFYARHNLVCSPEPTACFSTVPSTATSLRRSRTARRCACS